MRRSREWKGTAHISAPLTHDPCHLKLRGTSFRVHPTSERVQCAASHVTESATVHSNARAADREAAVVAVAADDTATGMVAAHSETEAVTTAEKRVTSLVTVLNRGRSEAAAAIAAVRRVTDRLTVPPETLVQVAAAAADLTARASNAVSPDTCRGTAMPLVVAVAAVVASSGRSRVTSVVKWVIWLPAAPMRTRRTATSAISADRTSTSWLTVPNTIGRRQMTCRLLSATSVTRRDTWRATARRTKTGAIRKQEIVTAADSRVTSSATALTKMVCDVRPLSSDLTLVHSIRRKGRRGDG